MVWYTTQLIFHGVVILLVGLLSGAGFGRALVQSKPEFTVTAWRVAHSSLTMGGTLMLVLALVVPLIQLSPAAQAALFWTYVVSQYAFAIALPIGAHFGYRGVKLGPPFLRRVVGTGNIIGIAGSLVGTVILLAGAFAAL
jgi:hypothetical protein